MRRLLPLLTLGLVLCPRTFAGIPSNVSFDFGAGVPQLAFIQGQAKVSEKWQLGLAYGLLGMFMTLPAQNLPSQTVSLGDDGEFSVSPTVTPGINTFVPFVRYFPGPSNFYLQLSVPIVQITADITGVLESQSLAVPTAALISGRVTMLQPLPMISVGDIWHSKIYFINLSIGMAFYISPITSVSLNGGFPDGVGDPASQAAALNEISTKVSEAASQASDQIKNALPVIPCISLSFGILL